MFLKVNGARTRRRLFAVALGALRLLSASASAAQPHVSLPPVNLGASSFMDGPGGPGIAAQELVAGYFAPRLTDANGGSVPVHGGSLPVHFSVAALALATYVGYTAPVKVLGGYWGVEVVVPVVHLDVRTPDGRASTTGIGDAIFSPLVLQLPDAKILGRPFFHRFDTDVIAPSGQYSATAAVSPGNNVWSVNPYYAFTVLLTDRIETSWRFLYLWNSANHSPAPAYDAPTIQPGQAFHFNGAVSVAVVPSFRIGIAGYFLTQVSDSEVGGRATANSRERAAGLGPGLLVSAGTFRVIANVSAEFGVENRPAGERAYVAILKGW